MTIKKWSGTAWVDQYVTTNVSSIVASGTPSSSNFLRGDGQWIVPTDTNNFVSSATFASNTLTLNRQGLTALTVDLSSLATDANNFLTGVSGSGNGTVTFTRSGLTNLTWNAAHTHAASDITSGDITPRIPWASTSAQPFGTYVGIGGGSDTVIASGEARSAYETQFTGNNRDTETLYLLSDQNTIIRVGLQSGWSSGINALSISNAGVSTFSSTPTVNGTAVSLNGHTHVKANITDFAHTHVKADITDFAHTHTYADITGTVPTWNQSTTGNAATATALQNARTIGGVSFNGTANINLPGVNTAGTQNTSGTAAVSTAATVTHSSTNSAFKVPFANTTGVSATGNYGLLQDTENTFTYNPSTNTLIAGTFSGSGASLTSLNGTNISSGTVSIDRLPTITVAKGGTGATDAATARTNLGLGNVTNESKATMFTNPTFTGTVSGVTKTHVGLGNVDNTSDANKPVSTATQTALDLKLNTSLKGANSGIAELDSSGKVPAAQLPSYVDDVVMFDPLYNTLRFASTNPTGTTAGSLNEILYSFQSGLYYCCSVVSPPSGYVWTSFGGGGTIPADGFETGKIYVTTTSNKTYRWGSAQPKDGSIVEISASLALGSTSATAHRGDHGATAYTHSQVTNGTNPHNTTFANIASKPTTLSGYGITDAEPAFTKNTGFNKNFGTTSGTVAQGNDARFTDARTPTAHTHGNITNAGAIGSTTNLVVVTGTSGVLTTASRDSIDSRTAFPTTYANITGTVPTWNQSTTGNAATATTLQNARTINGVSFNGSANITITAAPNAHTHAAADTTSGTFDVARIPNLSASKITSGTIDVARLPAIAITDTFTGTTLANFVSTVYSLDTTGVQKGDILILTTDNQTYVHNGGTAGTAADFTLLRTPTDLVTSVASKTGAVTLVKGDVGLGNVDNTADSSKTVANANRWTSDRTITIGNTGKTVNGTGNVSWTLAEIGATNNTGTVTSVDLSLPTSVFTGTGSVTTSGTLTRTFANQNANTVFAGPTTGLPGVPSFRTLGADDLPAHTHSIANVTGLQTALDGKAASAHTHGNITNAGAIGTTASLPIITTTSGVLTTGSFGTTAGTFAQGNDSRLSDARTPLSHSHGNITNAGAIGTTTNQAVVTGASGVLTTASRSGIDTRTSFPPSTHTHGFADITGIFFCRILESSAVSSSSTTGVSVFDISLPIGNYHFESVGHLAKAGTSSKAYQVLFTFDSTTGVTYICANVVFSPNTNVAANTGTAMSSLNSTRIQVPSSNTTTPVSGSYFQGTTNTSTISNMPYDVSGYFKITSARNFRMHIRNTVTVAGNTVTVGIGSYMKITRVG